MKEGPIVSSGAHVRDDVQLVDEEEHERAALGDRPVDLARLGDGRLGVLGDDHLGGDLLRGGLRLLEREDEVLVAEDVALRVGEHHEQIVLELLELDRELVLLRHELLLLLLQVGPLLGDDGREQLLLEPLLRHGEVDERALRLHLWDIMPAETSLDQGRPLVSASKWRLLARRGGKEKRRGLGEIETG